MLILTFLVLVACESQPDLDIPGTSVEWDQRFDALVEALEEDLANSQAPGVSVAVLEDGEITFARAFGSGHPDRDEPITADSLFQIGSTTKMLTASALLRKVQAGDLSLDDSLADVLPELEFELDPTWSEQIQVHHLLSHQAAVVDSAPWESNPDDEQLADYSYGDFSDYYYLMNPPGLFWNYSNPHFCLAALITQENDDRYWPDIMTQDIFQPLGMDRSYARRTEAEQDGDYSSSFGYVDAFATQMSTVEMNDVYDHGWTRPAGMVWSTPSQMVTFADFLMNGNSAVLDDSLRQEMTIEQVNTLYYNDEIHYGYAVFVARGFTWGEHYYQIPTWFHGGNTMSFSSELYMVPEQGFAISILSSGYGTDFVYSVGTALTTLLDLPSPVTPPEYQLDTSQFYRHLGTYYDQYSVGEVIISQEGDDLFIDMPDLETYGYSVEPRLMAVSTDLFYVIIDGVYYDITFIRDEGQELSTYIRNRYYVALRDEADTGNDSEKRATPPPGPPAFLERANIPPHFLQSPSLPEPR